MNPDFSFPSFRQSRQGPEGELSELLHLAHCSWADPAFTPWGALSGSRGHWEKEKPQRSSCFSQANSLSGLLRFGVLGGARGRRGENGVAEALCLLGGGLYDLCLRVFQTNWGAAKATALHFTHPYPLLNRLSSPASSPLPVAAESFRFCPLKQLACLRSCLC